MPAPSCLPSQRTAALDGNEAAAKIAYALSEIIAVYPITPASAMGEYCDAWAAAGRKNLWGAIPEIVAMHSEGGAAGALHGALTAGALATTFTSSQGLLLMLPNLYKIAGELSPAVLHVAARSVATQALSIFGDHSDVMAVRAAGLAMLASASVQEAHDLALVAHAATLNIRIPFLHFFDGFRTSHEIQKIRLLSEEDMRGMIDGDAIRRFRERGLDPERPNLRGTAQNPDTFFQARETVNRYYAACPELVQDAMNRLAARVGRGYRLFEYSGAPDAERVLVMMGSGCGAAEEAVEALCGRGEKVGLLQVRLYRPFSIRHFAEALPRTLRRAAVLDRTKEPGAPAEPLFLDAAAALDDWLSRRPDAFGGARPLLIAGRYGLASKEFTPAMAAGVFAELAKDEPRARFTVGITDDLTRLSLDWDPSFSTEDPETERAVFYGLGADGTVSANKNSIKIIAESGGGFAQGYFVYDSKKSGAMTVSHLRFGPRRIRSSYLVESARFVACHHENFLAAVPLLERAARGALFLLNTRTPPGRVWGALPRELQEEMLRKEIRLFVIDAGKVAREAGLGRRINTVMQTCFFALAGVVPDAKASVKKALRESYAKAGPEAVESNCAAVDRALEHLSEVPLPARADSSKTRRPGVPPGAPPFVARVTAALLAEKGERLPVSALPDDGVYPTGTSRYEKRGLAEEIPGWDERLCIQCNKCAFVCPHAAIRAKAYPSDALRGAPEGFQSVPWRARDLPEGTRYSLAVAPEDCTGCALCIEACPAADKARPGRKALWMRSQAAALERERRNFEFFLSLPEAERPRLALGTVKGSQLAQPLFEFSGACAGCGETPYLKLLSQLFGDRLAVANATGCSSIYGGNLPTTPWCARADGRGPAWSNSLFEDNAEFGLGFRLAYDKKNARARELLRGLSGRLNRRLVAGLLEADQRGESGIAEQRRRVAELKRRLAGAPDALSRELAALADDLVRKSVWIVGGDGWAYDIGFGGLDHALAAGRDVNLLVLDTECYSNTGGQISKATPRGAVAKFAAAGKPSARKDLAQLAMGYGSVYVACIAFGADDAQTVKALGEAESYPGTSLVIAYAHCIAHGFELRRGLEQQERAVASGYWPLFRYDPRRAARGEPPLALDSKPGKIGLRDYALRESRYALLAASRPEESDRLLALAEQDIRERWKRLRRLSE